jgi:hypothetical protein
MTIGADGSVLSSEILYRARVRNHAKLAYNNVAVWLEADGTLPAEIGAVKGLAENLRLQDEVAQRLKDLRHLHGGAESGDHRGQTGLRRRPTAGTRLRRKEPRQGNHREFHDRRQWRDCPLSGNKGLCFDPPGWCARPNGGSGLLTWHVNTTSPCLLPRIL